MKPVVAELVAEYEAAAKAAQQAEGALRKRLADEIARSERNRAFAFRRTRLVRALATAAAAAEAEDIALAAQSQAVRDELGWTGASAAYDAILDRLRIVGRVVWLCVRGADEAASVAVHAELVAFESWFEATHGKSFYALFDQYVPEVPVVDF
jgi:flavin-dependent dehydrogenase